jgi:hypothetical protein
VRCQHDQKVSTPTRGASGTSTSPSVGDPLTGQREQVTRRAFATATEASKARRELIGELDAGLVKPSGGVLTVNELQQNDQTMSQLIASNTKSAASSPEDSSVKGSCEYERLSDESKIWSCQTSILARRRVARFNLSSL